MKSLVVSLVGAAAITLLVPTTVSAQHHYSSAGEAGPYLRAGIGPAFTQDGSITEFTGFAAGNEIKYDTGLALEFAGGYAFNSWLAVELEFGFVGNEFDSTAGITHADTFLYSAPILAGVTLQHRIPGTIITPYVSASVGGSATVFDTDGFSNGVATLFGEDEDFVFAYQFGAGVRFDLNDQMSLGIDYKYFVTDDSSFEFQSLFGGGPNVRLGIEGVQTHIVAATFTFRF